MARNPTVNLTLAGDSTRLTKAFEDAGVEAKEMAGDVDKATRDMGASFSRTKGDAAAGLRGVGDAADEGERRIVGLRDAITGTGDVMRGVKEGDVTLLLTGLADIGSSIANLVVPQLQSMKGILSKGIPAASDEMADAAVSASARAGVGFKAMLGTAGIAGATLFGIIEVARQAKQAFDDIASGKGIWESIVKPRGWFSPLGDPINDFKKMIGLGHTGGMVPGHAGQNVPMILQAGETVIPRGSSAAGGGGITINVSGSVITERDLGRVVADALRNNRLIGVTA